MRFVRNFTYEGELIATLVKGEYQDLKTSRHATFISESGQSLQLGIGHYPALLEAPRHTHERMELKARYEEILHLIKGKMRVDLYGSDKMKFASFVMRPGDTVHFVSGGHGFKMLTTCKCVEVKQGPYPGKINKTVF